MVSLYSFLIQVQCAGLRVEQRCALRLGRHRVPGAVPGGGRVLRGPPAAFHDHRILRQEAAPPQEREQAPSQTQVCACDREVRNFFEKRAVTHSLVGAKRGDNLITSTWQSTQRKCERKSIVSLLNYLVFTEVTCVLCELVYVVEKKCSH